jgi:hypothetical protein
MSQVDFHGPVNFLGPVSLLGPVKNIGIPGSPAPGLVAAIISTGPVIADSDDLDHVGRVVGVSTGSAIVTGGEIEFAGWAFSTGDILYLSPTGQLSVDVPNTGFQQRVGVATSATSVIVSLNEPIILI